MFASEALPAPQTLLCILTLTVLHRSINEAKRKDRFLLEGSKNSAYKGKNIIFWSLMLHFLIPYTSFAIFGIWLSPLYRLGFHPYMCSVIQTGLMIPVNVLHLHKRIFRILVSLSVSSALLFIAHTTWYSNKHTPVESHVITVITSTARKCFDAHTHSHALITAAAAFKSVISALIFPVGIVPEAWYLC